jgi:hypothetical protein
MLRSPFFALIALALATGAQPAAAQATTGSNGGFTINGQPAGGPLEDYSESTCSPQSTAPCYTQTSGRNGTTTTVYAHGNSRSGKHR